MLTIIMDLVILIGMYCVGVFIKTMAEEAMEHVKKVSYK